jgi:aryl-alcohol dehydrogenase-like predicted oxidoreductase
MVHRDEFEHELQEVCQEYGLGVFPYSPLAGGFLTGKYQPDSPAPTSERAGSIHRRYANARGWRVLRALEQVAREQHASPAQVALAWLRTRPAVTAPIDGANSLEHLREALGALAISLHADALDMLNRAWTEE